VSSLDFLKATLAAAERLGTCVYWNEGVTSVTRRGHSITAVETSAGTYHGGEVVIAAGIQSAALARGLGLRLPLRGGKGYVIDLEVTAGAPQIPVTFKEQRVVATPYPDRLRLCGTFELGSDAAPMSRTRVQAIRDAGQRYLPGLQVHRTLQTWAGLRPCTPDGVPVVGRSERFGNLTLATGHGMWGLVLAPATAEMVACGLLEDAPTLSRPEFSPDRFSLAGRRSTTPDRERDVSHQRSQR
jgi:D-amino-acid dehydrogenase